MRAAIAARNREGVLHELGGEATSSMSAVNSQVLHEKDLLPREHGHSGRAADRVVAQGRASGREQVCLLRIEMAEVGSSRDLTHGWASSTRDSGELGDHIHRGALGLASDLLESVAQVAGVGAVADVPASRGPDEARHNVGDLDVTAGPTADHTIARVVLERGAEDEAVTHVGPLDTWRSRDVIEQRFLDGVSPSGVLFVHGVCVEVGTEPTRREHGG